MQQDQLGFGAEGGAKEGFLEEGVRCASRQV